MSLKEELDTYISATFQDLWNTNASAKVPSADDALPLGNKGVIIEAAVLYADLADSTGLVNTSSAEFAAEVYKAYVYAAAKAIRHYGGSVTAYDGDRVMGVFVGSERCDKAVDASFLLVAIIEDILEPRLKSVYPTSSYSLSQKVGIDQSELLVTNTGIRGNNDYVWVGGAANNAAKMAALSTGHSTYVTQSVRDGIGARNLITQDGQAVWTALGVSDLGYSIHGAAARKVHIPS